MTVEYNIVAIGAGFGGLQAVIQGTMRGAKCALIDKLEVGGECLNFGCIPTKSMVKCLEVYRQVKDASTFGVSIGGEAKIDFSGVMNRQKSVLSGIVERVHVGLKSLNIDFYRGTGTIISPGKVEVKLNDGGEINLNTKNIIIGTGSAPDKLQIPGADLPGVLTNREILNIKKLPASMVVIGCSYVGVEFGTLFASMGTRVTMLSRKNFLKNSDQKLAKEVQKKLVNEKQIALDIGLQFLEIRTNEKGHYEVVYEKNDQTLSATGEVVLMATGRSPFTKDLFAPEVQIAMNGKGVKINEYLETSLPNVYAVGDVLNDVMLAFSAATEGEVAADNCLGRKRSVDYSVIPTCVFTEPELASAGLTEEEATLTEGLDFGIVEYPFKTTPMAEIMNRPEGYTRMIYEKGSKKILGAHILGHLASELIAEMALAIRQEVTVEELAYFFHFHPSLTENLQRLGKAAWFMEEMKK